MANTWSSSASTAWWLEIGSCFLLSVIQLPFFQICSARKALASGSLGSSWTSVSRSRTYLRRRSVLSSAAYQAARASIQATSRAEAAAFFLAAVSMKLLARLSLLALAMAMPQ